MVNVKKVAIFVGGMLFGSAGFKILASKDAKKVYTQTTAAVLRMKDCTMETVSRVQEEAGDILADAKAINEARAAAAEQLGIWAERTGADIVRHEEGSDPAAVVYDGICAGKARGADVIIIDTAGRLHNKQNLMNELSKMRRIIDRELPGADVETLMVLDATTGQNGLIQAKQFLDTAGLTGIVLTKLDGTAKGGIVFAIAQELKLPVYLEDISSTRIRENIDKGRDISNLIDSVAQNFIYENSLYLREPQDKSFLEEQKLLVEPAMQADRSILKGLHEEIRKRGADAAAVERYIEDPDVRTAVIRNKNGQIYAFAAAGILETKNLYEEFGDISIAEYIRNRAVGKMLVIKAIYCSRRADRSQLIRLLMGEILSKALEEELVYAVYHPFDRKPQQNIVSALQRQGFVEISIGGRGYGIYEVDMKEPVVVIENMNTALKEPFNKSPKMQEILKETHEEMQRALIQYRNPDNYDLVKEALIKNGRTDLIGFGPKCLIPPRKISHNTGGKNFSSGKHKTVKNTTAYNNKGKHNSAGAGKRSSNNKSKSTKKGHKL